MGFVFFIENLANMSLSCGFNRGWVGPRRRRGQWEHWNRRGLLARPSCSESSLQVMNRATWRVFPEKSEYSVRADMPGQMAGNSNLSVLK